MEPASFPDYLHNNGEPGTASYLPGLARIELARFKAASTECPPVVHDALQINPTLNITSVEHTGLLALLQRTKRRDRSRVEPGAEIVLSWKDPRSGELSTQVAEQSDLLAIKLVVEDRDLDAAALEASVPVDVLDAAIREAVWKGLILSPPSKLRRETSEDAATPAEEYGAAEVFTLQWHLTQECDLHCRHCYDRSSRRAFPFERALTLMDELRAFCRKRFIRGQVSLSGGNPLLYPHIFDLYRAAAERDFMIAILGNASDRATIEKLLTIKMPVYYQVSLEGLEQHNDEIRGAGNYRRTVDFLRTLSDLGVPNMVMLTLTRHNLDQVIPLAEELEGITGGLAFNRLALFGEGASLELPTPDEYHAFLESYVTAMASHPVLRLKDSLFNIIFERDGNGLFGGCAGYGCGAAFNFVSILSDGEVHACRKFPSSIGNILTSNLEDVYSSTQAQRYRAGSSSCSGCSLNAVCRGCPAVTASLGQDPFTQMDPFCFKIQP